MLSVRSGASAVLVTAESLHNDVRRILSVSIQPRPVDASIRRKKWMSEGSRRPCSTDEGSSIKQGTMMATARLCHNLSCRCRRSSTRLHIGARVSPSQALDRTPDTINALPCDFFG